MQNVQFDITQKCIKKYRVFFTIYTLIPGSEHLLKLHNFQMPQKVPNS